MELLERRELLTVCTIDAAGAGGNGIDNGQADAFRLVLGSSRANVDVYLNGSYSQSLSQSGLEKIIVQGSADNGSLTIDDTNGLITAPIVFSGGKGTNTLILDNGLTAGSESYDVAAGTDSISNGSATQTVSFVSVQSVMSTVPVTWFNVTGTSANDRITYSNGKIAVNDYAPIEISNKANVAINGLAGNDTIETSPAAEQDVIPGPGQTWSGSAVPAGCPFAQSASFSGIEFTGRHSLYTYSDTWYPSWASDGNMYSIYQDGQCADANGNIITVWGDGTNGINPPGIATTGTAKIVGDDPMNLQVTAQSKIATSTNSVSGPYTGRYPTGCLVADGVWYVGSYGCINYPPPVNQQYCNPILGPFAGWSYSTNYGATWTTSPYSLDLGSSAMFPQDQTAFGGPLKLGMPDFVDFGQNMQYAPVNAQGQKMAYLLCHGSTEWDGVDRPANLAQHNGDQLYLMRVPLDPAHPERINDRTRYEFYSGKDGNGNAIWSYNYSQIQPLAAWNNKMGASHITYDAPLHKYLLFSMDGKTTMGTMDTYICESDSLTGPYNLITYLPNLGEQAYYTNLPSKFISADGKTAWMVYATDFNRTQKSNPPGGEYHFNLFEFNLLAPGGTPVNPLLSPDNVARTATVSVSSTWQGHDGFTAAGLTDGSVFSEDPPDGGTNSEWVSNQTTGASVHMSWASPVTIDHVWLFDRAMAANPPNRVTSQITSGTLSFSDGTSIAVRALPDDSAAQGGLEVWFEPKTVTALDFTVTGVSAGSQNVGLAELGVFRTGALSSHTIPDSLTINAGDGNDAMDLFGSAGSPTTIRGGNGTDTLTLTYTSTGVTNNAGTGTITGLGSSVTYTGVETVTLNGPAGNHIPVANPSFELPDIAYGTFQMDGVAGWNTSGAGINDHGGYNTGAASDGDQSAFIQSANDYISQTISFPNAGNYVITFYAENRPAYPTDDFSVQLDGVVLQTTNAPGNWTRYDIAVNNLAAGSHVLKFQGIDSGGGDRTFLLDNVSIAIVGLVNNPPTNAINVNNSSFESPDIATGTLQYGGITGWNGVGVGINDHGGFDGGAGSNGPQLAFVQGGGSWLSQDLSFPTTGDYTITFYAMNRPNCDADDFNVQLDGKVLKTIVAPNVWTRYDITVNRLSSGIHTLRFEGINSAGGDHTFLLDDISVIGTSVAGVPTLPSGIIGQWDASTLALPYGSAITSLSDLSGNGHDAAPADAANKPTFVQGPNGMGVVHFNGGDQGLVTVNNLGLSGNTGRSIFAVMRRSTTDANMPINLGSTAAYHSFGIMSAPNGVWVYTMGMGAAIAPVTSPSVYDLYEGFHDDVRINGQFNNYCYMNGQQTGANINADPLQTDDRPLQIGYRAAEGSDAAWNANGDFAELIIYGRDLSTAERQQVESYLFNKWLTSHTPGVYSWDGTVNTWATAHWYNPAHTLTAGGTGSADSYSINAGTLSLPASDMFGNAQNAASPVISIGGSGSLASAGNYTTLTNLTLAGGTLLCNGGANSSFPAFGLLGAVNVTGSSASSITAGSGSCNAINIGASPSGGNLTFNVADVTGNANADLTLSVPLHDYVTWDGAPTVHASGLTKTGAGTMVLTSANNYSGGTIVNEGRLVLSNAKALPDGGSLSVGSGSTLIFSPNWEGGASLNSNGLSTLSPQGAVKPVTRIAGKSSATRLEPVDTEVLAGNFGVSSKAKDMKRRPLLSASRDLLARDAVFGARARVFSRSAGAWSLGKAGSEVKCNVAGKSVDLILAQSR